ncbi:hypothetical protein BWI97_17120 [Siphonobacter sp. BAB-5405]|uniref:outer membrane protein assembly factor BamB family protein n=1 Tax=Siphonobacter sp. BAB-5405 TaxID=1864825 RepID=UPI000C80572D|nr:PQQ-binding-like beta-propeller repeat protein [Siphonobacter sp. BAB-5405]PMD94157.1 hypothetical protein BWI97_17120 [Siphonobacter sp. BAB-5405]
MKRLPLLFFLFYSILGYAQKQNSVRNDKAFMVLSDLNLYAIDTQTGKIVWVTENDSLFAGPVLADSTIYVRTARNKIYGYHVHSGKKVWESQLTSPYQNQTPYVNLFTNFNSLVIRDGLIYGAFQRKDHLERFGYNNTNFSILAIDISNGQIRWSYEMSPRSYDGTTKDYIPLGHPQFHRNALYIETSLGFLALDASTGNKLWEIDFPYSEIGGPKPAGYQDYIIMSRQNYSSDLTSGIEAYDAQTGRKFWENKQIDNGSTIEIADTILYVGDGAGYLFALELTTGKLIWKVKVPGKHISISIDHERIYVIGDKLSLYSKIDGTLQWQIEDKDFDFYNLPTLANEVLYLVGSDAFHAIDALTGRRKWSTTFKPHTISISQYPLIIDLNNKGYYPSSSPMKYIK